jgi:hypothetical protein
VWTGGITADEIESPSLLDGEETFLTDAIGEPPLVSTSSAPITSIDPKKYFRQSRCNLDLHLLIVMADRIDSMD